MNTKLNFSKEDITFYGQKSEKKLKEELFDYSLLIVQKDDEIKRLQKENERLKQNQVKALNRIRDFINASKCEIIEDIEENKIPDDLYYLFTMDYNDDLHEVIKKSNINFKNICEKLDKILDYPKSKGDDK